jgi:small subunit ribosomal protein S20
MANTKASKKDLRQSGRRRARTLGAKSALKTYVKKVRVAAESADAGAVADALKVAVGALDKASERKIIHKNQAARRKSRIAKAANAALKK